tara:strand:- start:1051 stop:3978 length:2928 start_codon:yes stop_codon:yes gene_type:complete
MLYPAGNGLSLRPDSVCEINYTNPTSTILRAPADSGKTLLSTASTQTSPDFKPSSMSTVFGDLVVERDAYVDVGSKTVILQPWARTSASLLTRKYSEFDPSHSYFSLFDTEYALDVPSEHLPKLGYSAIPCLEADTGVFYKGLTVWAFDEDDASSEVIVNLMGRSDFDVSTYEGTKVFTMDSAVSYESTSTAGGVATIGCRYNSTIGGIEFPQYIAPGRVIAVFEKSDFVSNGMSGTNLLVVHATHSDVETNVYFGVSSDHTDVTFTLLSQAITGFSSSNDYIVVANSFGYRPGFLLENSRVCAHTQVAAVNQSVTLYAVSTQPLPSTAVVQVAYTRTPYQGEILSRLEPFASTSPEPFNNRGLISSADSALLDTALTSFSLDNPIHGEVLSVMSFATSIGTGRLSGLQALPYYGVEPTAADLPSGTPMPYLNGGRDLPEEISGASSRLPLGARYRDANFVGEPISLNGGEGTLSFGLSTASANLLEASSPLSGMLSPGKGITLVEGNHSASALTQYRVTRGGSAYVHSDGTLSALSVGGGTFDTAHSALYGVAALVRVYDVEAATNPELAVSGSNPVVLKSRAGELRLVIATKGFDNILTSSTEKRSQLVSLTVSPSGAGEGTCAVDMYRCAGLPLEHVRSKVTLSDSYTDSEYDNARATPFGIFQAGPVRVLSNAVIQIVGVGLTVRSNSSNRGVEVFLRDRSAGADAWTNVTSNVISSSDTLILLKIPSGNDTDFDLMLRSGDGRVARYDRTIARDSSGSSDTLCPMNDNFLTYTLGTFPESWSANNATLFRLSPHTARVGHVSGVFEGSRASTTDIVRKDFTNLTDFQGDNITAGMSLKLTDSTIPTSNFLRATFDASVSSSFTPLFGMSLSASSTVFEFVLYDELTGSGDVTVTSTVALDTDWHDIQFVYDVSDGTVQTTLDGSNVGSAVAVAGTAISSSTYITRFEIQNTSAVLTQASVHVDGVHLIVS